MEGIGTLGGMDEEPVTEESPSCRIRRRDGVRIVLVIHRILGGGAQEEGRNVGIQRIFPDIGRVSAMLEVLDEGERDAVGLVQEEGLLAVFVRRRGEGDVDFADIHRRIPDPGIVDDTAVLQPVDGVGDDARVQEVLLTQIVGGRIGRLVACLCILEDTGAAIGLELQGEVQGRSDVLRGEDADVVVGQGLRVEQVAVVGEFRVRGLGVEHREGGRRIGPTFVGGVVADGGRRVYPLEEIEGLDGGTRHSEIAASNVLLQIGIVVEMVVERGVPFLDFHAVEMPVVVPGYEPLEIQAVGEEGGFQDARGVLPDAVLDVLEAVLDLLDGILTAHESLHLLFVVVFLALCLGQAGVPARERFLCGGRGIGKIQGVDDGPVQGITCLSQRVHDDPVGEGILHRDVPAVQERVRVSQALGHFHRVPGIDLRKCIFRRLNRFLLRLTTVEKIMKGLDEGSKKYD